jgi:ABC-type polysaccharide/polyol phosphate export permease
MWIIIKLRMLMLNMTLHFIIQRNHDYDNPNYPPNFALTLVHKFFFHLRSNYEIITHVK